MPSIRLPAGTLKARLPICVCVRLQIVSLLLNRRPATAGCTEMRQGGSLAKNATT
jgi:hypothetical protein